MDKRGIVATEVLIYLILGFIVLVVLAGVFSSTVRDSLKKMIGLTPSAEDVENSCRFNGGICTTQNLCDEKGGYSLSASLKGSWSDCKNICCRIG